MKKLICIILIIICSLGVLPVNSQTLERFYHSKKVDSIVAKVDSVLRSNATWMNGSPIVKAKYCHDDSHNDKFIEKDVCLDSIVYVPIYGNISFYNYRPVDSLTKDYFLSWRFVKDLDSVPKQDGTIVEAPWILLYDYSHREVYEIRGWDLRKNYINSRLECCDDFDYNNVFYKFVAEMCYGDWVDFVFYYPTVWDKNYCYPLENMLFAVKGEHLYVIYIDGKLLPCICPIEDFTDFYWDKMVHQ